MSTGIFRPSIPSWTAMVLAAACVTVAAACYWDRDTLKAEARGLPGVLEAVVGRFERYPAAYYAARLERAEADRSATPGDWRSWDDAVVALDRLGRCDEAVLLAMAQRAAMDATSSGPTLPDDEAQYRQLANHGTVLAHRWIASGVASDRTDLLAARDLVAAAIELNPDAHFGREAWQLLAIEWLIDGATIRATGDDEARQDRARSSQGVPSLLDLQEPGNREASAGRLDGLVGIITLGGGWDSIDILIALYETLARQDDFVTAYAVEHRINELLDAGRRPLHPATEIAMHPWEQEEPTVAAITASPESFPLARRLVAGELVLDPRRVTVWYDAERETTRQWEAERVAWVGARLATHHPDRDADFWEQAPPMPALVYPGPNPRLADPMDRAMRGLAVLLGVTVVLVALVAWAIWRLRRPAAPPA